MSETKDYWIGFDLGGTKMLAVVYDASFQPVGRSRKRTKGHEGQKAGLQRIIQTMDDAMKDAKVSRDRISGIGIGCPGPLNLKEGVILEAPNLGWTKVPIKKALRDAFKVPVVVANDVDAGVFGEYKFGAGKNANCVVGIFPGTGIGGGCVYRGQLIQGTNSTCMEIGHIPILSDGPVDGFGNAGTLESLASRLAISGSAAQAAYRGQAPHLRKLAGTDISEIRSGVLAESIQQGDESVLHIIRQANLHLSKAVVTLVLLLAPDIIVLGGGLVEAMPDQIVDSVSRLAKQQLMPSFRDVFTVKAAKLGDDATAIGAAAWAKAYLKLARP